MPKPWVYFFSVGVFLVAVPLAALLIRWLVVSVPSLRDAASTTPTEMRQESQLQKIRLVRGATEVGRLVVSRAIGVSQVYEVVADAYWVGHRNELSAVPEAGPAHLLSVVAWDGFERYNAAVRERGHISNEDLERIAKDAQRAVDALGVADALRRHRRD